MLLDQYAYFAAANYNCGAYGAGSYDANSSCDTQSGGNNGGTGSSNGGTGTTTNGGSNGGTGPLADTGYNIIIPVVLGLAVLAAGIVLVVKKLTRRQK